MKNSFIQEIIISLVIVILLFLFLNPFDFWMPDALLMMLIVILIITFSIFAGFIWKESVKDEREMLHRMFAGRVAYLVGVGMLMLGVVIQSLSRQIDLWLILTLSIMILAKIVAVAYGRIRN